MTAHRTPSMVSIAGSVRAGRAAAARDVVTGNPDESRNSYGPLGNARHFEDVCRRLAELPEHVMQALDA